MSSRHGSIDGAYSELLFPVYCSSYTHLSFLRRAVLLIFRMLRTRLPEMHPRRRGIGARQGKDLKLEVSAAASEGGEEGINIISVALKAERYRPRIYGFQINEITKLQRWQEAVRVRVISMDSCAYSCPVTGKFGTCRWVLSVLCSMTYAFRTSLHSSV